MNDRNVDHRARGAERVARCLCGALTVTTQGMPWRSLICSCLDCRRKSGSAYGHSTYWPRDAVNVRGTTQNWQREAQSGRSLTYHFCPTCGVSVYWEADFAPDYIGIGGGNFADGDFAPPRTAYWTEGQPCWAHDLSQLKSKDRQ